MIKKQVASLLFNKNRADDDDTSAKEEMPDLIQPSTEIVFKTQDLTNQISSKATSSPLPISIQKVILRAKEVLEKNKDLLSKLNK